MAEADHRDSYRSACRCWHTKLCEPLNFDINQRKGRTVKRDWDLLRKQLIDIEEEQDVLAGIPDEPKWTDQTEAEFMRQYEEYRAIEGRIAGHLELLVDNGYVEGIQVLRGADGHISLGLSSPRLTMAGHDLLDTMRSKPIWEKIKTAAQSKGIELTFDAIKTLGSWALKQVIGAS